MTHQGLCRRRSDILGATFGDLLGRVDDEAQITITNDDDGATPQQLTYGPATFVESVGTANLDVTRTQTTSAASFTVTATNGAATSGADFSGVPATLSFAAGQATATLSFAVVDDQVHDAQVETFQLGFSGGGLTAPEIGRAHV